MLRRSLGPQPVRVQRETSETTMLRHAGSVRSRPFLAAVLVVGAVALISGMAASQAQREAEVEAFYRDAIEELLASPSGRAFLDAYIALRRDYLYATDREALLAGATEGLSRRSPTPTPAT
jgi:hypothetical protein